MCAISAHLAIIWRLWRDRTNCGRFVHNVERSSTMCANRARAHFAHPHFVHNVHGSHTITIRTQQLFGFATCCHSLMCAHGRGANLNTAAEKAQTAGFEKCEHDAKNEHAHETLTKRRTSAWFCMFKLVSTSPSQTHWLHQQHTISVFASVWHSCQHTPWSKIFSGMKFWNFVPGPFFSLFHFFTILTVLLTNSISN